MSNPAAAAVSDHYPDSGKNAVDHDVVMGDDASSKATSYEEHQYPFAGERSHPIESGASPWCPRGGRGD